MFAVRHLGRLLDLLVEYEQVGQKLGVVGGLPGAKSVQKIERTLPRQF